jgi:hypothetical protein
MQFKISSENLTNIVDSINKLMISEFKKEYDNPNVINLPSTYLTFYDKSGKINKQIVTRYGISDQLNNLIKNNLS